MQWLQQGLRQKFYYGDYPFLPNSWLSIFCTYFFTYSLILNFDTSDNLCCWIPECVAFSHQNSNHKSNWWTKSNPALYLSITLQCVWKICPLFFQNTRPEQLAGIVLIMKKLQCNLTRAPGASVLLFPF